MGMQRNEGWLAALAAVAITTLLAAETPGVGHAIPPAVSALGKPALRGFPGGIRMAVTAATAEAQAHVNQGLNHLHGGWEFEASRHFAAALQDDSTCLLAHWGMVMCLLDPSPESVPARNAAAERMLDLIDQGAGTELERGYAYGLIKYMQEGPAAAADAFRKVAENFPNDVQAPVFAALFGRGGYDVTGEATPDQLAAEKRLLQLSAKHPQSPIPLHALLFIRAESASPEDSLPLVSKLGMMVPDYPPYLHLAAHYHWRAGNHRAAAEGFRSAASRYEKWRADQQIPLADNPEWIKAAAYHAVALASCGDIASALAAARTLAALPLLEGRPSSPGNRMLLWEARSLPARLLLARAAKGDIAAAAASLPAPDSLKKYHKHSLAYWWLDGLRFVIETERLIAKGDLSGARQAQQALAHHGEAFAKMRATAAAGGEASFWNRSFPALEVLAGDLRGRTVMAGPRALRSTAYNWFSSAAERQRNASLLMPPPVLTPMASRLGDYFLDAGKPEEAVDAYQRALEVFPNHLATLEGLQKALLQSGKPAEAKDIRARLESLGTPESKPPRRQTRE